MFAFALVANEVVGIVTGFRRRRFDGMGRLIRRLLILAAPFVWRKFQERRRRKKEGQD